MTPRTALDTSVLVAALERGHPHHALAAPYLEEAHDGRLTLLVSTHALAETFATLTVLRVVPLISTVSAERLIQESVLRVAEVVTLDAGDYAVVLRRMAALGLASGAVYDALHIRAAEAAGADEIVTFNGRDFRRMPPEPPCRLVVLGEP